MNKRCVITGIGCINALGSGIDSIYNSLINNKSGITGLSVFESEFSRQYNVAEVSGIEKHEFPVNFLKNYSRTDNLAYLAVEEAIQMAGLKNSNSLNKCGLIFGTSVAGILGSEKFLISKLKGANPDYKILLSHEGNSFIKKMRDVYDIGNPVSVIITACSSGANAIGLAYNYINSGKSDMMIAVGSDSLSRITFNGFRSLMVMSKEGCKPFSSERDGMTLGEGAAALILESYESAVARRATILAEISGWGNSCDAYHSTAPQPEGEGAVRAMQTALRSAGIDASSVKYINAHGTGTKDNDSMEANAIKKVFNSYPSVSSTKGFTGHTLGAAGAIEAVFSVMAFIKNKLPVNLKTGPDNNEFNLNLVYEPMDADGIDYIISNSFAFGGNNTSLIFKRYKN